jgi:1-deoxy-D-xylulose-5-phosphate synthase
MCQAWIPHSYRSRGPTVFHLTYPFTQREQCFARKVKVVSPLEDHVLRNGFGAGVLEQLSDAGVQPPVVCIGWPDQFIGHAPPSVLRQKYGLSVENTVAKVLAALGQA